MNPPEQRHLEVIPRLRRAADLELGAAEHVERAHQVLVRIPRGQRLQPIPLALDRDLRIGEPRRIDPDHEQVADDARQFAAHETEIVAGFDGAASEIEDGGGVLARDRVHDVEEQVAAHEAEYGRDVLRGDVSGGERHDLIERAQAVAQAALRRPREQRQGRVVDADLLSRRDVAQPVDDRLEADRLQLEHERPRLDCLRHLVELGRRHHEDDVRRWLLDGFEERVEGVLREAVDFVDDERLVPVAHRPQAEAFDDGLADFVDPRVGGGVDLEHVDAAALRDLDARIAGAARVGRRALRTVQRPRQNARERRLAHAARPREDERLADAIAGERVPQGLRHAFLADDIVEALGAVLAREDLVGHEVGIELRREN